MAGLLKHPEYQARLLGFFDFGTGHNLRPQPGEPERSTIKSIGAGVRLGSGERFSLSLDWGYALDDSTVTRQGGTAVHFKGQLAY